MENHELENRWLMLKASRDTANINDALDYLELNFILSPENIIKDLATLKKGFVEMAQSSARESLIPAKRTKTSTDTTETSQNSGKSSLNMAKKRNISGGAYESTQDINPFVSTKAKKTNPSNNSITEYLSNTHNMPQDRFSEYAEDELDSFSAEFQLPKPQPMPHLQPQPNYNLNDSKESVRTANFVAGSEQTFANDSHQNILPESAKKRNRSSPTDYQSLQWESQYHPQGHAPSFPTGISYFLLV